MDDLPDFVLHWANRGLTDVSKAIMPFPGFIELGDALCLQMAHRVDVQSFMIVQILIQSIDIGFRQVLMCLCVPSASPQQGKLRHVCISLSAISLLI